MHQIDATASVTSDGAGVNWTSLRASVLRFVRSRGIRDDAEDVTDESLCIALQRYRPNFNTQIGQHEAMRRFAFGIAERRAKSYQRTAARHTNLFRSVGKYEEVEDLIQGVAEVPDEAYSLKEADTCIRRAMDALSDTYRLPFYLRYCQDRPIREIAELLDLNTSTVKVRLHRARLLLQEQLRDLTD